MSRYSIVRMRFMANNIKQGDNELPLTHSGHGSGIVYIVYSRSFCYVTLLRKGVL